VGLVAVFGCAAAARFAVAPPAPRAPAPLPAAGDDLAGQGFAQLFARRYLTWAAANPALHQQGLASFVGSGIDADAGATPPPSGSEQVLFTDIVQSRASPLGGRIYTVAVQTDAAGLQYLAVPVVRRSDGRLGLAGYPALVGAPASRPFVDASASLPQLADPPLATVVTRALRNYLAGASSDLAADLAAGARVSVPTQSLALSDVLSLRWSPAGHSVVAEVLAADARGAQYTLAYELAVVEQQSRWEVSAIEIDPDA
jgi:hypothetical protein